MLVEEYAYVHNFFTNNPSSMLCISAEKTFSYDVLNEINDQVFELINSVILFDEIVIFKLLSEHANEPLMLLPNQYDGRTVTWFGKIVNFQGIIDECQFPVISTDMDFDIIIDCEDILLINKVELVDTKPDTTLKKL